MEGGVSAFKKALNKEVEVTASISSLVLKRSLEIRDRDETDEKEEVVVTLCLSLGRPADAATKREKMPVGGAASRGMQLKIARKYRCA